MKTTVQAWTGRGLPSILRSVAILSQPLGKKRRGTQDKAIAENALREVKNHKHRSLVKTVLRDKTRLVKRVKIGGMNLVCSLSRLGADEVESFVEGGVVFINRDHPLFAEAAREDAMECYHLARLITQELVKLARPERLEQAFDWQSRLLTDALVERKKAS